MGASRALPRLPRLIFPFLRFAGVRSETPAVGV